MTLIATDITFRLMKTFKRAIYVRICFIRRKYDENAMHHFSCHFFIPPFFQLTGSAIINLK